MFKRKRATVLGVSLLAALGLMSVSAAGAQAGQWTMDGKALIAPAYVESQGGPVTITGGGIQIACTEQRGYASIQPAGTGSGTLSLYGCEFPSSESCVIPPQIVRLNATMTLNKDGSQVVFVPASETFGSFFAQDVEGECGLYLGDQNISLSGKITASLGSAAVKLSSSTLLDGNFHVGIAGMYYSSIKSSSSMWLVGANAGKVLGTSS